MIKTIKKAGIIFSFATVLIGSSTVMAQLCVKSDCDALGYTTTAAACKNHFNTLLCPFDNTKALCGGEVVYNGTNLFYYNGVKYSVINGGMWGVDFASAKSKCEEKGYRLPTSGEVFRITSLARSNAFTSLTIQLEVSAVNASSGLWFDQTCSGGHNAAYINGTSCKPDTQMMSTTVCVKKLD